MFFIIVIFKEEKMNFRITALTAFFIMFVCSFTIVYAFESELWPGEGIPVFLAKKNLKLYEEPSLNSQVIKGDTISKGEKIDFGMTRFRTIKPGKLDVLVTDSTTVSSYGAIDYLSEEDYYHSGKEKVITFKSSESFEILQYRAEGNYFFRINGEVVTFTPEKNMKISSEPVTEWWVQALDMQKKPIGWVLIDEKNIKFLNRVGG
jgi:hypothetical protein